MHLYVDIGDASLSLWGSTSSLVIWLMAYLRALKETCLQSPAQPVRSPTSPLPFLAILNPLIPILTWIKLLINILSSYYLVPFFLSFAVQSGTKKIFRALCPQATGATASSTLGKLRWGPRGMGPRSHSWDYLWGSFCSHHLLQVPS